MKIEIAHDILARKIYEDASIEDKSRAKAKKLVEDRYKLYLGDPKILLSEREFRIIDPYLKTMSLSSEQNAFVQISKDYIKKVYRYNKYKSYAIIILVCSVLASMWVLWWRSHALKQERIALEKEKENRQRLIALYGFADEVRSAQSQEDWKHILHKAQQIQDSINSDQNYVTNSELGNLSHGDTNANHEHADSSNIFTNNINQSYFPIHFEGTILDVNKRGIPFAELELLGLKFKTNSKGHFHIDIIADQKLLDQKINIRVYRDGFDTLNAQTVMVRNEEIIREWTLLKK